MKKKLITGLGIFFGVVAIGYIGTSIYFNNHYLPNTTIGVVSCGGKSADYVVEQNTKVANNYSLFLTDRKGKDFALLGVDFSYEYVPTGEEEKILKSQNPFSWPFSFFKKYNYELNASCKYDSEKLTEQINQLELFTEDYIEAPVNAYIDFTEDNYIVVDEVMGTTPISEQIISEIEDALDSAISEITLSDNCYENPTVYATDSIITDTKSKIDSYLNATIHYEIEGVDENLSTEDILKILKVNDEYNVTLQEDKIQDFVQHLASTYNTYGDVRSFKTSSGDTVKIGGGDYGWVISKTNEAKQIKEDLEGGQPVSREPVYEQTAKVSGLDDIGDTYIEIDYGKQHLWYYKNGKLQLETDIVSGNLRSHNGSVDGIFKIAYKERDATLIGEGYSSAVKYFMPFAYNIGIHDAGWRGSFGGKIYKTSGSHGCINIPPAKAKKLFEIVETGTPVVAFYREKVKLTNEAARISNAYSYVNEKK